MTVILIADACKPSIVMTSEIFKDRIPGIEVHIAASGKETLEKLTEIKPDMCIVDFDLPDVDGPSLIEAMRKPFAGPILMTAFNNDTVRGAVESQLYGFLDASGWVEKPVRAEPFGVVIDKFLVERHHTERRFNLDMGVHLVGKAAGRGKRAPKVQAALGNLSLSGAMVAFDGPNELTVNQELTVALQATPPKKKTKKASDAPECKLKAHVVWKASDKAGIRFDKVSEIQKKSVIGLIKQAFDHQREDK